MWNLKQIHYKMNNVPRKRFNIFLYLFNDCYLKIFEPQNQFDILQCLHKEFDRNYRREMMIRNIFIYDTRREKIEPEKIFTVK